MGRNYAQSVFRVHYANGLGGFTGGAYRYNEAQARLEVARLTRKYGEAYAEREIPGTLEWVRHDFN